MVKMGLSDLPVRIADEKVYNAAKKLTQNARKIIVKKDIIIRKAEELKTNIQNLDDSWTSKNGQYSKSQLLGLCKDIDDSIGRIESAIGTLPADIKLKITKETEFYQYTYDPLGAVRT